MDTDTRFDVVISVAIRWNLQAAIFIAHSVVFPHNSLFGFVPTKVPNPPQDLTMLEAHLSGQVAAA